MTYMLEIMSITTSYNNETYQSADISVSEIIKTDFEMPALFFQYTISPL